MNGARDERRLVLVVTETDDSGVIAEWCRELNRRRCWAQVTNLDECLESIALLSEVMDGILLDDVDPGFAGQVERLLHVFLACRPMPRVVLLASSAEEVVRRLADDFNARPNVLIHPDGQPMEECFAFLSGEGLADNLGGKKSLSLT